MNGTTNKDRTLYYEMLPSNQLDLALFLEADRMRSLDITKENLDNQRNAVQEERRLGVDNQPYGRSFEVRRGARLRELRVRALGDRIDGRPERRDGRRREVVLQDLLRTQQRGASDRRRREDAKVTLEKVRKYFESISVAAGAAAVDMTEPPQTDERRQTVDDALARLARVDMVYTPPSCRPTTMR